MGHEYVYTQCIYKHSLYIHRRTEEKKLYRPTVLLDKSIQIA